MRKNKKRIDPRYFLHETTYRDLDESTAEDAVWERLGQQIEAMREPYKTGGGSAMRPEPASEPQGILDLVRLRDLGDTDKISALVLDPKWWRDITYHNSDIGLSRESRNMLVDAANQLSRTLRLMASMNK